MDADTSYICLSLSTFLTTDTVTGTLSYSIALLLYWLLFLDSLVLMMKAGHCFKKSWAANCMVQCRIPEDL